MYLEYLLNCSSIRINFHKISLKYTFLSKSLYEGFQLIVDLFPVLFINGSTDNICEGEYIDEFKKKYLWFHSIEKQVKLFQSIFNMKQNQQCLLSEIQ